MGRLFDAVAALLGVCETSTYEGQPAIELENTILPADEAGMAFEMRDDVVDAAPVIAALVAGLRAGLSASVLAGRFHAAVAGMLLGVACRLRRQSGLDEVALSGGVWQNATLLRDTTRLLEQAGFRVMTHRLVPANDGGLALGQAAVAAAWLSAGRGPACTAIGADATEIDLCALVFPAR
jgi:hydrogenase maturation protein HypF